MSDYHHVLTFPKPPSTNQLINKARANRFAAANEKKKLTEHAKVIGIRYLESNNILEPLVKPFVGASISYQSTASDLDNLNGCLKTILDGLVLSGLMSGDSLSHTGDMMITRAIKVKGKENQIVELHLVSDLRLLGWL